MFFRLAFRNLTRNFRRTLLSLASIVAGVAVIIVGKGFIAGLEENIIRAQVDTMSSHVMVRPDEYPTEGLSHPVDELLVPTPELRTWLDGNTQAWTTRTFFVPTAVHLVDSLRVRGIIFDPATDEGVFPRSGWKVDGKIPATAEDGVLVSKGVARLLKVTTGERIVLQGRTHAGAINALEVPVSGVVSVGSPLIDNLGVFVPLPLGEDLLRLEGGVSHVLVRLRDRSQTDAFVAELTPKLTGEPSPLGHPAEISTWEKETAGMLQIQRIRESALDFLVLALMGMSASGIANTILMAAYERIREIGTLQALGMTRGGVLQLFVFEGAVMGIVGSLVGAGLGSGLVLYYAAHGIDLSSAVDQMGNVPISTILYLRWSPWVTGAAIAFGSIISVGASVYPARVASRMVPADAVRA